MEKCPCKDCLTLPICKSIVHENMYSYSMEIISHFILTDKCNLIDKYCKGKHTIVTQEITKTLKDIFSYNHQFDITIDPKKYIYRAIKPKKRIM